MASDTSYEVIESESDSDIDSENEVLSSTDNEDTEEVWNDVSTKHIMQDLNSGPPPVPANQETRQRGVAESLVFWFGLFSANMAAFLPY